MKSVGEIISTLFDDGLMKKAESYSAFFSCWKDLMEKNRIADAADHSWVKNLEHGVVQVEADHPGWKQILQTKQSKLLADFRYRFPDMDISGLSISLCKPGTRLEIPGVDPSRPPAALKVAKNAPPKKNLPKGVSPECGYDNIKDGSLKVTLMRLERSIAERAAERDEG